MEISLDSYVNNLSQKFPKAFKRDLRWMVLDVLGCKNETDICILKNQETKILRLAKQLNDGVPLAYCLNSAEFFGCKFYVDSNVLIPRFETEELVELVTNYSQNTKKQGTMHPQSLQILDLCSGSGCIAISLQKTLSATVDAVEIDKNNCNIIEKNAQLNNAKINVINSDMFNSVNKIYDIIVSNPPYIKTCEIEKLDESVKNFEPNLALDGGTDGLKFYKEIAKNAPDFLVKNGMLFLEIGYDQAQDVEKLLQKNFDEIKIYKDLSGKNRMISAKKRG